MSKIKGIILAGGRGTRLLPQTKINNKHLLPVYTIHQGAIPMIWYPLYTLIKSGCKDIMIVSSQEHSGDIIEFLGDGEQFGCSLTYRIQDHNDPNRPVGIASAMKLIEGFVVEGPFAVILGDNFFEDDFSFSFNQYEEKYNKINNILNNEHLSFAHVFLKEVPNVSRFGVATISNTGRLTEIIEKPQNPKSNYAVTGLYLFNHSVFPLLNKLKVSDRGELEISHLNQFYIDNGTMDHTFINKFWSDMGVPESMIKTIQYINETHYCVNFRKEQ